MGAEAERGRVDARERVVSRRERRGVRDGEAVDAIAVAERAPAAGRGAAGCDTRRARSRPGRRAAARSRRRRPCRPARPGSGATTTRSPTRSAGVGGEALVDRDGAWRILRDATRDGAWRILRDATHDRARCSRPRAGAQGKKNSRRARSDLTVRGGQRGPAGARSPRHRSGALRCRDPVRGVGERAARLLERVRRRGVRSTGRA